MGDDTSLRPRPGETAEDTVARVVAAVRRKPGEPSRDQIIAERSEVEGATWASCTEGLQLEEEEAS